MPTRRTPHSSFGEDPGAFCRLRWHPTGIAWALAIAGWECRTMIRGRARRKETFDDFAAAASGVDAEHELASGSF